MHARYQDGFKKRPTFYQYTTGTSVQIQSHNYN